MKKKTQKIITWIMLIAMVLGAVASIVVYLI